jgi:hypothetical protein
VDEVGIMHADVKRGRKVGYSHVYQIETEAQRDREGQRSVQTGLLMD